MNAVTSIIGGIAFLLAIALTIATVVAMYRTRRRTPLPALHHDDFEPWGDVPHHPQTWRGLGRR